MTKSIDRAIARQVLAARRHLNQDPSLVDIPFGNGSNFTQERAALARDHADNAIEAGVLEWRDLLEESMLDAIAQTDLEELRRGLLFTAAYAQAWIAELDRRTGRSLPASSPRTFTASHARLVFLLAKTGGATHTQLARRWQAFAVRSGDLAWPFISESGLRTRVSELALWGLAVDSGRKGRSVGNKPSTIWELASVDLVAHPGAEPVPPADAAGRTALLQLLDEAGTDVVLRIAITDARRYSGADR